MAYESPIVTEGEGRDWLRLHAMARDFLLGQFDKLPAEERCKYHERAAAWYAEHGNIQDAARHALASGNDALAIAHASRCLRDIAREGRLGEAREWIRRLPPQALAQDVGLQLTVAWITALGDGAASVPALIEQIGRHPQFNETHRFEAAVIAASASVIRDQPGPLADALRGWEHPPSGSSALHVGSFNNVLGNLAYIQGDTERARQILAASLNPAPRDPRDAPDIWLWRCHIRSLLPCRRQHRQGNCGSATPAGAG